MQHFGADAESQAKPDTGLAQDLVKLALLKSPLVQKVQTLNVEALRALDHAMNHLGLSVEMIGNEAVTVDTVGSQLETLNAATGETVKAIAKSIAENVQSMTE